MHWRRESIVICTSKSKPILEPWPEAIDERRRFKIVTAHPTVGPEGTEPSPDGQVGILLGPRFRNGASAYHFTYTFLPSSRVSLTQGN